MIDLQGLNTPQYEAVTTTDGPVLVIAGAGSGKTRTLVYRVAHLVEQGVAPEAILLLTFTRKASQEMLWRAGQLLNETCNRVVGGTFHGVANTLLRRYGSTMGFGSGFTIIDRADAEGIANLLRASLGLGKKEKRFPSRRMIINLFSGAVNRSLSLEELVDAQHGHLTDFLDDLLLLQEHYASFKRDHGLMDYDDLLVNWRKMVVEFPEIREVLTRKFSHVMVDEYQDTNLIQADIVRQMGSGQDNVMVVGDDSQSIYSFRGADFYNIMRFPKDFQGAKIIKLEENYRSSQPILSLTNEIIEHATEKYTKTLFTRIEGEIRPMIFGARDEREEAAFIVQHVNKLMQEGVELENIAVLFRSGFHSYKLEMELGSQGIEFEKRGGLKLTESAHMKDMIAFFRVQANPKDSLSWSRILLQLEKVGPATAKKISTAVVEADDAVTGLRTVSPKGGWKKGFDRLLKLYIELQDVEGRPIMLFERILDYYQPVFERIYHDDFPKRQKDLDQLKAILEGYDHLQDFLDDTSLDPPEEVKDDSQGFDRLILSTIHSSKGLEFDAVFVMGLAEGRFPHGAAVVGEQWEEERRLLYVAATRARKYLYLTYPRQLMTQDRQFRRVGMSPFLGELNPVCYERIGGMGAGRQMGTGFGSAPRKTQPKPRKKQLQMSDFSVGSKVGHPFFGEGVVTKISGARSLDIQFDRHGLKTLHLDYAKLTVL